MPDDDSIAERLARIERVLLDVTRSGAEPPRASAALEQRIAELEREKRTLDERVKALSDGRVQARPEQVSDGFRKAIEALQVGLRPQPGDRSAYTVSEMQVTLKALVALGDDGSVRFVLPTPDERFEPAQLSEVRFALRTASEATAALPDLIPVPSLLGLPRAAAEAALARVGLKLGPIHEQESRYPTGTVIGQAPDPGDEVVPEVPIEVTVAVAIKPTVPDLRGLERDDAQARIEALGLTPGTVQERESKDAAPGTVLTHEPLADMRVEPGTAVMLVVAIAPPPTVRVPDLGGLPRIEAEASLRRAGLEVGTVVEREGGRPGAVLRQGREPGDEVPPATPIELVVAADLPVEVLIDRAVKLAAGTRAGISGRLLGERLRALELADYAAFETLANASLEELQKAIAAPTPRGLQDAQQALRKALAGDAA